MENNEQSISPEQSLEIIRKAILGTRKNMIDGSFYYLLWGWLAILAGMGNYLMIRLAVRSGSYDSLYLKSMGIWLVFVVTGLTFQFIHGSRRNREKPVRTFIDRALTILWSAAGVVMAVIVFFCFNHSILPVPYIMIILALATFVSGMTVRFRPLVAGGIFFAVGAVVAFYMEQAQLPVFAVSTILGYIIPGYMLRNKNSPEDV